MHLGRARRELPAIAAELRTLAAELGHEDAAALAVRVETAAGVGWPPRGRSSRARHRSSSPVPTRLRTSAPYEEEPFDVSAEDRGLSAALVEELSRLGTHLDAYSPAVVDLLAA